MFSPYANTQNWDCREILLCMQNASLFSKPWKWNWKRWRKVYYYLSLHTFSKKQHFQFSIVSISVRLFFCLSFVFLSFFLSVFLSVCLSVTFYVFLSAPFTSFIFLSICLHLFLSFFLSQVWLLISLSSNILYFEE